MIKRLNPEIKMVMTADFFFTKFSSFFPIKKSLMPEIKYVTAIVAKNKKAIERTTIIGLNQLISSLPVCSDFFEATAKLCRVGHPV